MQPFTITKKQAAHLLGVTVKTLTQWQNKKENPLPIMKAGKRGQSNLYDPQKILNWKVQEELSKVIEIDGERLNLDEQKARLAKEQADGTALKNAQTRREVAPINLIEWILGSVGSQLSAILETIPLKVKRRVPKLTANDIQLIRREIIKAQNIASRITVDIDDFRDDQG